jgi:predicted DNA-binding protein
MVETVSVSMEDELANRLRQRKKRTGVPVSVYIRDQIKQQLDEEEEE